MVETSPTTERKYTIKGHRLVDVGDSAISKEYHRGSESQATCRKGMESEGCGDGEETAALLVDDNDCPVHAHLSDGRSAYGRQGI